MCTTEEFLNAYRDITSGYATVIKTIADAEVKEAASEFNEAARDYDAAIYKIDEVFSIPIGLPSDIESLQLCWNDACAIIRDLKLLRPSILYKQNCIKYPAQQLVPVQRNLEVQTTPDVSSGGSDSSSVLRILDYSSVKTSFSYIAKTLRKALEKNTSSIPTSGRFTTWAKLYKVETDGTVLQLKISGSLSVVKCGIHTTWKILENIFFIQFSTDEQEELWVYPLIPGIVFCSKIDHNAYIFPDMESECPGEVFCLVFEDEYCLWEELIESILKTKILAIPSASNDGISHSISNGVVAVADVVSESMIKLSEGAGNIMTWYTPHLMSKISEKPPKPVNISQDTVSILKTTENITAMAASVTGYIVDRVGYLGSVGGNFLAPHAKKVGTNILTNVFEVKQDQAESQVEHALVVAGGVCQAIASIYNGARESAKIIGTNIGNNSVKIIEHAYGPRAGEAAAATVASIGNTYNTTNIFPNAIAKRIIKETAKNAAITYKAKYANIVRADELYPNLNELKKMLAQ